MCINTFFILFVSSGMNSSFTLHPHSFFYLFTALKSSWNRDVRRKLLMQRKMFHLFICSVVLRKMNCYAEIKEVLWIHFTGNVKKLNPRIPTFQSFICLYKSVKRYIKKKKRNFLDWSINQSIRKADYETPVNEWQIISGTLFRYQHSFTGESNQMR